MPMCTIIQPFTLIFAKEEKLWRVLLNVIGIYLESSSLYITVDIFLPRSFLKAASINSEEIVLRIQEFKKFVKMGFYECLSNLPLRVFLFVYLLLQMKNF